MKCLCCSGLSPFLFRWDTAEHCGVWSKIPAWPCHLEWKPISPDLSTNFTLCKVTAEKLCQLYSELNTVSQSICYKWVVLKLWHFSMFLQNTLNSWHCVYCMYFTEPLILLLEKSHHPVLKWNLVNIEGMSPNN